MPNHNIANNNNIYGTLKKYNYCVTLTYTFEYIIFMNETLLKIK